MKTAPFRRWCLLFGVLLVASLPVGAKEIYEKDVAFALKEMPKACQAVMAAKSIDWAAVEKEFTTEAPKVSNDEAHALLLTRLLARLRDGHAAVVPTEKTKGLKLPEDKAGPPVGGGLTWCRINGKLFVKNAVGAAAKAKIKSGMEVIAVDGQPVAAWLDTRIKELSDRRSFSTDHQAFFFATHAGLGEPAGTRREYELRTPDGRTGKVKVTFNKPGSPLANEGPAFLPDGLTEGDDVQAVVLPSGYGYIHVRRSKSTLPEQMDVALKTVGAAPGVIVDFRGNSGGGFDHEALLGRFLLPGETIRRGKGYQSAGPNPYGGKVVVIVDGSVVSAGETGSGIFKEDGRAYMIGESPTAGMSSSKTTLPLPSGLFGLYVSVASNKGRFNGGKGIEGIGVPPHELVAYDPKDLAAGMDTLIKKAEALLKDFAQAKVPYRPK